MSMVRWVFGVAILAAVTGLTGPVQAESIDDLKGQFAFDWFQDPSTTTCAAVDDALIARFKSDTFTCDLSVRTNTASEEPARVCSQKDEQAEYLIFATKKACELEREVQISNGD